MEQDEWLDLVDENDVVVGRELRSVVHAAGKQNYRAINVFIRNSKGELWIPRRTADKDRYPSALDFSCAGHVQSGDTYEDTVRKELAEELNMDVSRYAVRTLGKVTPVDFDTCFAMNYEIESDETPQYNHSDFTESFWLTPQALIGRIQNGDKSKNSLPFLVKRYYLSS